MVATLAMSSHRTTSFSGGMSRTSSTYHPCQMIFNNWDSASSPLWHGTCWRESGQKWTIGLTCAVWHGVPTLSVCKVTCQNFESFPNYWCISRDCRLTGYLIINMWKCYLLFELPCIKLGRRPRTNKRQCIVRSIMLWMLKIFGYEWVRLAFIVSVN
jgi:hypothetical protein